MIYDVVIVGDGPCGLAVASRLCEQTPSALFSDHEHTRFWSKHHRKETLEREAKRNRGCDQLPNSSAEKCHAAAEQDQISMLVLDTESDRWMTAWRRKFADLQISHLRSPLFFHPDPRDRDGLLAFAHESGRETDLQEIPNVVGKELSKHKHKKARVRKQKVTRHLKIDGRDRIDYYTPSTKLFDEYCDCVARRYNIQEIVHKGRVQAIRYGDVGNNTDGQLFTVSTDEATHLARTVVLAVGPGRSPCVPHDCKLQYSDPSAHVCHAFEQSHCAYLPDRTKFKIQTGETTNVVIIGGV